jgi:hypothetical protein
VRGDNGRNVKHVCPTGGHDGTEVILIGVVKVIQRNKNVDVKLKFVLYDRERVSEETRVNGEY